MTDKEADQILEKYMEGVAGIDFFSSLVDMYIFI
jgi:hypothetical protein